MSDKSLSVPATMSRNAMRIVSLCEQTICEHGSSEKKPDKRDTNGWSNLLFGGWLDFFDKKFNIRWLGPRVTQLLL